MTFNITYNSYLKDCNSHKFWDNFTTFQTQNMLSHNRDTLSQLLDTEFLESTLIFTLWMLVDCIFLLIWVHLYKLDS